MDVNPVLEKDEGLYECQVNTRDKMSLVFKLNVARKYIMIEIGLIHFLVLRNTKYSPELNEYLVIAYSHNSKLLRIHCFVCKNIVH